MGATAAGTRHRVPAAERRQALIEAAVEEFAQGGLHGTPVDRIAKRVGVAQPYVFSLFPTKRDLFLAAVERGFVRVEETFARAAEAYRASPDSPHETLLAALGDSYVQLLVDDRSLLMLQLQSYAACDDPEIRESVESLWRHLTAHVQGLSGASEEELTVFFASGMLLNVQAAIGITDFSEICATPMPSEQAAGDDTSGSGGGQS